MPASTTLQSWKNIFEILALGIAGVWAVFNFKMKEAPLLEKSANLYIVAHMDSVNMNMSHAIFDLHIKNIGKTNFDVTSVKIRYWLIPFKSVIQNRFYSPEYFMKVYPATDSIIDSSLNTHYGPDLEYHRDYEFFLTRSYDTTILLKADVTYSGREWLSFTKNWSGHTYTTILHCIH